MIGLDGSQRISSAWQWLAPCSRGQSSPAQGSSMPGALRMENQARGQTPILALWDVLVEGGLAGWWEVPLFCPWMQLIDYYFVLLLQIVRTSYQMLRDYLAIWIFTGCLGNLMGRCHRLWWADEDGSARFCQVLRLHGGFWITHWIIIFFVVSLSGNAPLFLGPWWDGSVCNSTLVSSEATRTSLSNFEVEVMLQPINVPRRWGCTWVMRRSSLGTTPTVENG